MSRFGGLLPRRAACPRRLPNPTFAYPRCSPSSRYGHDGAEDLAGGLPGTAGPKGEQEATLAVAGPACRPAESAPIRTTGGSRTAARRRACRGLPRAAMSNRPTGPRILRPGTLRLTAEHDPQHTSVTRTDAVIPQLFRATRHSELDHVSRGQYTRMVRINFHLRRNVVNPEPLAQVRAHLSDEGIARMPFGHHQMRGQRSFRRAHCPHMKIMHLGYYGQAGEISSHFLTIDLLTHRIKGHTHRVAQETPGAGHDDTAYNKAHHRVKPRPAGVDDTQSRQNDAQRYHGIGSHVEESATNIEVVLAPGHEQNGGATVDHNAKSGHPDDGQPFDRRREHQPLHRLPGDTPGHQEQECRIDKGSEHGALTQAVGKALRWQALHQQARAPRQHQAQHIAQVMRPVREERDRVRPQAIDYLNPDIGEIGGHANGKSLPEISGGVRMTV